MPTESPVQNDALAGTDDDATGEAIGRITSVEAPSPPDEDVLPGEEETAPTPIARKRKKKYRVPGNLEEPVLRLPVTLKLVSFGKGVANVTATLTFAIPQRNTEIIDLLGAHAYAASFAGTYLGNGVFLKDVPFTVSGDENEVHQSLKVTLPRWESGADQLATYIAALISKPSAISEDLLALDETWRLNINVDEEGDLALYQMQQSFDLTKKADD